ncbi:cell surface glycoprotein 1-like [Eriocheir sinensis]|uniref:cell surface glycoprotein 1-like n=1 Tax=Eriocheir sinensis TaxID=95602 RepID=UPI0021C63C1A|nr:cell surface glycoprotein 1-like [Eriocheir sinensis]
MRTTVLVCWAVVGTLVVAAEATAFRYVQPVHDIAAAYENYHQLWMAEARRNSVAPMSPTQRIARPRPRMRLRKVAAAKKAEPSPVAAEKPAQEKAATETEKLMPEERAQKPMVAEKTTETQTVVEEQTPAATTELPVQTTTAVEQTTTEQVIQEEVTTQMPVEDQTAAEARVASKQVAPEQILSRPGSPTDMKNAFDSFFTRWNAERIRNSRPPVALTIPEMRRELQLQEQRRLAAQAVSSMPVDTPAATPAPEAPVDTLTKSAPAPPATPATASDAAASAAGNDWLSLAQQQGASPLIIVLQHPGAGTPVLG